MPFSVPAPVLTILFVDLVIFPQHKLQQEHEDAKVLFSLEGKSGSQRKAEYLITNITEEFN